MKVSDIHLHLDEEDGYDGFYQFIIIRDEIWIWRGDRLIKKISIKNMILLAISQFDEEVK